MLLPTILGTAVVPPYPAEKGRGAVTMTGSVPGTWSVDGTTVMEELYGWTVVNDHLVYLCPFEFWLLD